MITVIKPNTPQNKVDGLIEWFREQNLDVHVSAGKDYTVLGLVGDTSKLDMDLI